ncbi:MAG: DMT family transporter [Flavobacteriia bacterium]|nr:DMT family transporter [Flavobacteriia bacterium]
MDRSIKNAHFALLAVALIYGVNYIMAKEVMNGFLEPRGFILLRASGASILFWIVHRGSAAKRIERSDIWRFALAGLFGVALNQIMFFEGLQRTTPINASIIMTINPIIVLVLSAIVLKEGLGWLKIVGIALGASGAIWLISGKGEVDLLNSDTSLGNLLILVNATSYALYLIVVKPLMKKYPPIQVIKWVFGFGLIYVLPFGAGQLYSAPWETWTLSIYAQAGFVVVFTTFFAYLLNVYALKSVSSTTVSAYIYLQPVFATSFSLMLGFDMISWREAGAAGLIFTGVYLANFYRRA